MKDTNSTEDPFHFRIIDDDRKCYRDYFFLNDSKDIENKIFHHIMYFGQNTKFHDHEEILKIFTSLCHKVNVTKCHLVNYREIESKLETELSIIENLIDHDGRVLIEKVELTAVYESFLMQVKATLDILVKFLNIVYREGKKNPLKYQSTFSDGGKGVVKSLEKYLKSNPEETGNVTELLNFLKLECAECYDEDPKSINWLIKTINDRDTVTHFRKHEYFAFQISYIGEEKIIIPPKFTKTQSMLEFFEIIYDNLLVFIQDFIALLFIPYLDKRIKAFTYEKEDVTEIAPKWHLQLGELAPYLVWQNMGNLSIIKNLCKSNNDRLTPEYCERMYLHYSSFYNEKGVVITSRGIEDHQRNQIIKLAEQKIAPDG